MTFPIVDREPIRLPTLAGHDDELWDALIELSEVRPGEWTLIGGQMVFLHAIEQGAAPPRVSTDLDVLVNAANRRPAACRVRSGLEDLGFEQDGISPDGIAHRYRRNRVTIDVLAPEGLGERTDLTTTPPGRTLQVPGGTQALDRTELVPVALPPDPVMSLGHRSSELSWPKPSPSRSMMRRQHSVSTSCFSSR